jgi:hypothetical protein
MRVSPNWAQFYRLFSRAFPKHPIQEELDLLMDEEE